jgi:hypothetical protein
MAVQPAEEQRSYTTLWDMITPIGQVKISP